MNIYTENGVENDTEALRENCYLEFRDSSPVVIDLCDEVDRLRVEKETLIRVAMAAGYVMEHRKVMYDSGTDPTGFHVHHINGDKTDNRRENLECKTESDHHREHIAEAGFVVNQFGTWPLHRLRA